jgi:predicted O-methyltransferase YrrM
MMPDKDSEKWAAVDNYISDLLAPPDEALTAALAASEAAKLPPINVTANQGKLLHLFARMIGAKKILEIGTLGGYSTIWMARALPPGGKLTTIEFDPKHADVARSNFQRAGLSQAVDLRQGRALDILPKLESETAGPFDLIFIDADKPSNPDYFTWALKLSHIGSVIIVDNVVRNGRIIEPDNPDAAVQGTRKFYEMLSKESRVTATAIQTVGSKGYDGFAIATVIR